MSDIADDIRAAVNRTRDPDGNRAEDHRHEDFMKLRANVRGAIIQAHRQLMPENEWSVVDDRILDVVTNWLESKRR